MKETYPVPYPVMYKNVYKFDDMKRSEHMAVRDAVGWYLWTHQLVEVTGKDAAAFLDYIFPKNISNLKNGRERYTTMLDENAQIIDDVVVFRMEDEKFWISTLFKMMMFPWFEAHKGSYQVEFKDITKEWEMYAVQGPRSIEMVNALVKNPVDNQKFFEMKANEIDGIPVYVNRAGFTGEKLGYELYFPKAEAPAQEEKLRALAPNFGGREVTEFQVMAWTLPCEAGFYYMRDLRHTNPYEVGLANGINFDKDFIGKEALMKIRDEGPAREVVGFTVAEDNIHIKGRHMGNEGEKVFVDGEEIGRVMKIVYSYVNEINNGLIICKKGVLKAGDHVSLHGHDAVICGTTFLS
jgi:aminomethyltransferase